MAKDEFPKGIKFICFSACDMFEYRRKGSGGNECRFFPHIRLKGEKPFKVHHLYQHLTPTKFLRKPIELLARSSISEEAVTEDSEEKDVPTRG